MTMHIKFVKKLFHVNDHRSQVVMNAWHIVIKFFLRNKVKQSPIVSPLATVHVRQQSLTKVQESGVIPYQSYLSSATPYWQHKC